MVRALARGVQTSIRSNSAPYGYSVTITASLAAVASLLGTPSLPQVFLFLGGAAIAFTTVELVVAKGFRVTEPVEPERVVMIATAFNAFAIAIAVAAAALVGWQLSGWLGWTGGSFAATVVYLLVVGLEMAAAERAEEHD